jgi:hypothetical protein
VRRTNDAFRDSPTLKLEAVIGQMDVPCEDCTVSQDERQLKGVDTRLSRRLKPGFDSKWIV